MDDFLAAMEIFKKYMPDKDSFEYKYPFNCQHDIMYFNGVQVSKVSEEDITQLEKLGFDVDSEYEEIFSSYKYGSN